MPPLSGPGSGHHMKSGPVHLTSPPRPPLLIPGPRSRGYRQMALMAAAPAPSPSPPSTTTALLRRRASGDSPCFVVPGVGWGRLGSAVTLGAQTLFLPAPCSPTLCPAHGVFRVPPAAPGLLRWGHPGVLAPAERSCPLAGMFLLGGLCALGHQNSADTLTWVCHTVSIGRDSVSPICRGLCRPREPCPHPHPPAPKKPSASQLHRQRYVAGGEKLRFSTAFRTKLNRIASSDPGPRCRRASLQLLHGPVTLPPPLRPLPAPCTAHRTWTASEAPLTGWGWARTLWL